MSDESETLIAIKALKYRGRNIKPGEAIEPMPDATLARQLVDGRYARRSTTPLERPAGSGRGGARRRKPTA